jgi:hypothetical protein
LASTQATSQAAELFAKLKLDFSDSDLAALPPDLVMDIPCLNARLRRTKHSLRPARNGVPSCVRRPIYTRAASAEKQPRASRRPIIPLLMRPHFGFMAKYGIRGVAGGGSAEGGGVERAHYRVPAGL